MTFQAQVYQVLICSPSDVQEERGVIEKVIHAVNALHAFDMGSVLLPVRWETHTSPKLGDRPQAIINKQIVESCDILVAAFWTRIGTPTGVAESGSVEEIKEFMDKGKPVLLYFSDAPVALASVEQDQYKRLTEFKEEFKKKGLIESYSEIGEFSEKLHPHLLRTLRELKAKGSTVMSAPGAPPAQTTSTPKTPKPASPTVMPTPLEALGLRGVVNMMAFNTDLGNFVRQLDIEWSTERDSGPINTDEGKMIIKKADRKMIGLRSHPCVYEHPDIAAGLDKSLRSMRSLQRHQTYMDGGKSFQSFWDSGNGIIEELKALSVEVSKRAIGQRENG